MTRLRCRKYGSSDWTYIEVFSLGEEDPVEEEVLSIIGAGLETSPLHVQLLDEETNRWEDFDGA